MVLFGSGLWYRYRTNAADERGATKLMRSFEQAAEKQRVLRMIRRSDNLNARDKAGRSALFYAVRHTDDAKMIQHLLQMGADATLVDITGQTALMMAARYNPSEEILMHLLAAGAPVNTVDNAGYTALLFAVRYNTPGVVKKLLRAGADADTKTLDGQTVVELLAENDKFSQEEKEDYALAFRVLAIIGPHPRGFINGEKR